MQKKLKCPICQKTHRNLRNQHSCFARIASAGESRGRFKEIVSFGCPEKSKNFLTSKSILEIFRNCLESEYVDFDKKGRGSSLNHCLYGYDPEQEVAVIQARQAYRQYSRSYLSTRKTYFLCGHNENGSPFRHPISSSAIRGSINAGANSFAVIRAAQRWMWEVTDKQLSAGVRQGDLLLVPESRGPKDSMHKGSVMTMAESHEIHSSEIHEGKNGKIYALNPRLVHLKGQHVPIAISGWASVRVARESRAWDFAERVGD